MLALLMAPSSQVMEPPGFPGRFNAGVMNSKLVDIQAQRADVPALKLEVAKQAIQVEQNKQDIKELRQLRGLK